MAKAALQVAVLARVRGCRAGMDKRLLCLCEQEALASQVEGGRGRGLLLFCWVCFGMSAFGFTFNTHCRPDYQRQGE